MEVDPKWCLEGTKGWRNEWMGAEKTMSGDGCEVWEAQLAKGGGERRRELRWWACHVAGLVNFKAVDLVFNNGDLVPRPLKDIATMARYHPNNIHLTCVCHPTPKPLETPAITTTSHEMLQLLGPRVLTTCPNAYSYSTSSANHVYGCKTTNNNYQNNVSPYRLNLIWLKQLAFAYSTCYKLWHAYCVQSRVNFLNMSQL